MSDETKAGSRDKAEAARPAPSIDLPASAVHDITPKPSGATTEPPAAPADTAAAAAPVAPEPARETAPPPAARSSSGPVIGGAVAGAIFGLLGTTVFQNLQAPPVTVADARVAEVEAAIAAVEKKAVEAAAVEKRLAEQLKAVEARATAAAEQKAAALEQRAAGLEQKFADTAQAPARLPTGIEERLKAAETALAESASAAAALTGRIETLSRAEVPKVDLAPLSSKIDAVEKALGSTAARVTLGGDAAQALETRIKAIEQGITEMKARRPADSTNGVLVVSGLARRAFEGGEALGPHLAALAGLGTAEADLAPLKPYADKPAPRGDALAAQLTDLVAALPKPAPEKAESLVDRLKSGLLSQVEVRATGTAQADVAGGLARVRARLAAGDMAGAAAEVAALPAEQREGLKPFAAALAGRIAAVAALRKIEADALAAAARKG